MDHNTDTAVLELTIGDIAVALPLVCTTMPQVDKAEANEVIKICTLPLEFINTSAETLNLQLQEEHVGEKGRFTHSPFKFGPHAQQPLNNFDQQFLKPVQDQSNNKLQQNLPFQLTQGEIRTPLGLERDVAFQIFPTQPTAPNAQPTNTPVQPISAPALPTSTPVQPTNVPLGGITDLIDFGDLKDQINSMNPVDLILNSNICEIKDYLNIQAEDTQELEDDDEDGKGGRWRGRHGRHGHGHRHGYGGGYGSYYPYYGSYGYNSYYPNYYKHYYPYYY